MHKNLSAVFLAAVLLVILQYGCSVPEETDMKKKDQPLLKVGIISDIHGFDSSHDWGMHHLESALQLFQRMKIDVLVMGGDLAEGPDQGTYRRYRNLLNKHFGKELPGEIFCDGNHDAIRPAGMDPGQPFLQLCRSLGRPAVNPWHCHFKGYDFIAFSLYKPQAWRDFKTLDQLLEKLTSAHPGRPVFVLTHEPPGGTLPDSAKRSGNSLRKILDKYSEAVSISGHTHWPLEDERTLWQGDFVAMQSATLSYGCMTESGAFNLTNGIVPFAREVNQALYMEIYSDRMEIRRYNVHSGEELLAFRRWRIPLPYRPGTDFRKEKVVLPQFASDAQVLLRYDFGYLYLIFDTAVSGDPALYYEVEIAREREESGQWEKPRIFRYVSDFYRWPENRQQQQYFKLPNILEKDVRYRLRIYPVESYGGRGKFLEIVHRNLFPLVKDARSAYPQE